MSELKDQRMIRMQKQEGIDDEKDLSSSGLFIGHKGSGGNRNRTNNDTVRKASLRSRRS